MRHQTVFGANAALTALAQVPVFVFPAACLRALHADVDAFAPSVARVAALLMLLWACSCVLVALLSLFVAYNPHRAMMHNFAAYFVLVLARLAEVWWGGDEYGVQQAPLGFAAVYCLVLAFLCAACARSCDAVGPQDNHTAATAFFQVAGLVFVVGGLVVFVVPTDATQWDFGAALADPSIPDQHKRFLGVWTGLLGANYALCGFAMLFCATHPHVHLLPVVSLAWYAGVLQGLFVLFTRDTFGASQEPWIVWVVVMGVFSVASLAIQAFLPVPRDRYLEME